MARQAIIERMESPSVTASVKEEVKINAPQPEIGKKKNKYEVFERSSFIDRKVYECNSLAEISQGIGLISSNSITGRLDRVILKVELLE